MTTEMLIIRGVPIAIILLIIAIFFIRPRIQCHIEQKRRQEEELRFQQDRMDIDQATRDTCEMILDEMRRSHQSLNDDWLRWWQGEPDPHDLFMSHIPDYGTDEEE